MKLGKVLVQIKGVIEAMCKHEIRKGMGAN
jgi:hypothetical protein